MPRGIEGLVADRDRGGALECTYTHTNFARNCLISIPKYLNPHMHSQIPSCHKHYLGACVGPLLSWRSVGWDWCIVNKEEENSPCVECVEPWCIMKKKKEMVLTEAHYVRGPGRIMHGK